MINSNLYEWPHLFRPHASIVLAPQNVEEGRITREGYDHYKAVPGSRNQMRMTFPERPHDNGELFPWFINNAKLHLFKVPVWRTAQLATNDEMAAIDAAYPRGLPFSTGQFFSTGYGFRYNPEVYLTNGALAGTNIVEIDLTKYPGVLTYGKVFNIGGSLHHVDDVTFNSTGTQATIKIRPNLRRNVTTGEPVGLRPFLIGRPTDLDSFIALFTPKEIFQPGALTIEEYVDERFI